MAITRTIVAQDENDVNQWLMIDHQTRYIVNSSSEWQFLFGPNSSLNTSTKVLKAWAQLDTNTLDDIRLVAYLYNPQTGSIDTTSSVQFNIYRVEDITTPRWNDLFITTVNGIEQSNNYFFQEINVSSLTGATMDGNTTLMIEIVAARLGVTYRDRIYVNHLGVYTSVVQLRNEVEFLDLTKLDE